MNFFTLFIWIYDIQPSDVLQSTPVNIAKFTQINLEKILIAENKYKSTYYELLDEIGIKISAILIENKIIDPEIVTNEFKQCNTIIDRKLCFSELAEQSLKNLNDIIAKGQEKLNKIYYELQFYDFLVKEIYNFATFRPHKNSTYKTNKDLYLDFRDSINKNISELDLLAKEIIQLILLLPDTNSKNPIRSDDGNIITTFYNINKIYNSLINKIFEFRGTKIIYKINTVCEYKKQLLRYNNAHYYYYQNYNRDPIFTDILTYYYWYTFISKSIDETYEIIKAGCVKMNQAGDNILDKVLKYHLTAYCAKLSLFLFLVRFLKHNIDNLKANNHKSMPSELLRFDEKKDFDFVVEKCKGLLLLTRGLYFGKVLDNEVFSAEEHIKENINEEVVNDTMIA